MNQQWNGGNSFMEGIDAGNRLFESIAEVKSKEFALEAAKTELPMRLMDLQIQSQQKMQSLKIQMEEAPLRLKNIISQGRVNELGIQEKESDLKLRSLEVEDKASTSSYLKSRLMGEDVPDPVLNTASGIAFFNAAKANTDFGQREQMVKTEWKSKLSKLTPSQFSEVMNMPLGNGGHPTPSAWGRVDDYLKINQEDEAKREIESYTEKQKAMGSRQKELIEAKIDGKLELAHERSVSSVSGITDPIELANVRRQLDAVKADTTLSLEQRLYRMDEITKKSKAPGGSSPQSPSGDTDTQEMVAHLATKRKELMAERMDAVIDGDSKKVKRIDEKIKLINSELDKLPKGGGSVKDVGGDGIIDYDPGTRGLKGKHQDQGPEYIPALDGKKGTDSKGSIIAKTKTEAGVEREYVFPTPKGIDDFVKMIRKMPTNQGYLTDGPKNLRRDEALLDSGRAAFYEEYAEMFDIQKEKLGNSHLYKSSRSIAKERVEKDYKEAERLINSLPDGAKVEFWKNVADRITKKPFNKINGRFPWVFDWSYE